LDEDRSLIKRKETNYDDDDNGDAHSNQNQNIQRIKHFLKISSLFSVNLSEISSSNNSSI
jgi:hypothetical protein